MFRRNKNKKASGPMSARQVASGIFASRIDPADVNLRQLGHHGSPAEPTALAHDPVLDLLAVGTYHGVVKIFGKFGIERMLDGAHTKPVRFLAFITGQGGLLSVTTDSVVQLWDLEKECAVASCTNVSGRITALELPPGWRHALIGTHSGDLFAICLRKCRVTRYKVLLPVADAIVAIRSHPIDLSYCLIVQKSGIISILHLPKGNIVGELQLHLPVDSESGASAVAAEPLSSSTSSATSMAPSASPAATEDETSASEAASQKPSQEGSSIVVTNAIWNCDGKEFMVALSSGHCIHCSLLKLDATVGKGGKMQQNATFTACGTVPGVRWPISGLVWNFSATQKGSAELWMTGGTLQGAGEPMSLQCLRNNGHRLIHAAALAASSSVLLPQVPLLLLRSLEAFYPSQGDDPLTAVTASETMGVLLHATTAPLHTSLTPGLGPGTASLQVLCSLPTHISASHFEWLQLGGSGGGSGGGGGGGGGDDNTAAGWEYLPHRDVYSGGSRLTGGIAVKHHTAAMPALLLLSGHANGDVYLWQMQGLMLTVKAKKRRMSSSSTPAIHSILSLCHLQRRECIIVIDAEGGLCWMAEHLMEPQLQKLPEMDRVTASCIFQDACVVAGQNAGSHEHLLQAIAIPSGQLPGECIQSLPMPEGVSCLQASPPLTYPRLYIGLLSGEVLIFDENYRQLLSVAPPVKTRSPVRFMAQLDGQGRQVGVGRRAEAPQFLLVVWSREIAIYKLGMECEKPVAMTGLMDDCLSVCCVSDSAQRSALYLADAEGKLWCLSLLDLNEVGEMSMDDCTSLWDTETLSRLHHLWGWEGAFFLLPTTANELLHLVGMRPECENPPLPQLVRHDVEMPGRPKNFALKSLFSKPMDEEKLSEVLDQEAVTGPNKGTTFGSSSSSSDSAGALRARNDAIQQAMLRNRQLAVERGKKLSATADKSSDLAREAAEFNQAIKQLSRR
jgi:hypothetical protein